MNLKKSLISTAVVIIVLLIIMIVFKPSFSGVYIASWVFSLLFGAATTHFFRFEGMKRSKMFSGSVGGSTYFNRFNLLLLLIIIVGFTFLLRNLMINHAFNVIHVSLILYGTGLLLGNNYKGFQY